MQLITELIGQKIVPEKNYPKNPNSVSTQYRNIQYVYNKVYLLITGCAKLK